jgi:hypothetical protein
MKCLTGLIQDFFSPHVYEEGELIDIIVATAGSVLFGIGYHGWIIATRDGKILLCGGGLDDQAASISDQYHSYVTMSQLY